MAKIDGYEMPDELYYHKEHTWARVEYKKARVGMTDYARNWRATSFMLICRLKGMR